MYTHITHILLTITCSHTIYDSPNVLLVALVDKVCEETQRTHMEGHDRRHYILQHTERDSHGTVLILPKLSSKDSLLKYTASKETTIHIIIMM